MNAAYVLPTDTESRNEYPMADGLLFYFGAALAAVAKVSKAGNDQHNPGQPMHWARGKSTDHANKIIKHLLDYDQLDTDGNYHVDHLVWRALALAQEFHESRGAPMARNARPAAPVGATEVFELAAENTKGHRVVISHPCAREDMVYRNFLREIDEQIEAKRDTGIERD